MFLASSCKFITFYVGNYLLALSKLLHIKLRGEMCLTKTKTNWKCGMENALNCRQISTQLGLELEVGIVYMFPEDVRELFLVHILLSHQPGIASFKLNLYDFACPLISYTEHIFRRWVLTVNSLKVWCESVSQDSFFLCREQCPHPESAEWWAGEVR